MLSLSEIEFEINNLVKEAKLIFPRDQNFYYHQLFGMDAGQKDGYLNIFFNLLKGYGITDLNDSLLANGIEEEKKRISEQHKELEKKAKEQKELLKKGLLKPEDKKTSK